MKWRGTINFDRNQEGIEAEGVIRGPKEREKGLFKPTREEKELRNAGEKRHGRHGLCDKTKTVKKLGTRTQESTLT